MPAAARALDAGAFTPSAVFVQGGRSSDARSVAFGASWDWSWQRDLRLGRLGGRWDAVLGRWRARHPFPGASAHSTHLDIVPVLRLQPAAAPAWFVEAGLGVTLLSPLYRTRDKQFSTVFNFTEHLGAGRCFGERCAHELALRVLHVSNANLKRPNPGETQVQLRYTVRL